MEFTYKSLTSKPQNVAVRFPARLFCFLYPYAMLGECEIQFRKQVRSKIQFWNEHRRLLAVHTARNSRLEACTTILII